MARSVWKLTSKCLDRLFILLKRLDSVLKVLANIVGNMVWMLEIVDYVVPSTFEIVFPIFLLLFPPASFFFLFLSLSLLALFLSLSLLLLFKLCQLLFKLLHLLLVIVSVCLHNDSVHVLHIKCVKVVIYEYLVKTLMVSVDDMLTESGSE